MSKKLLADPKVATLVERTETKATKAEQTRILRLIQEKAAENRECEDKTEKKIVASVIKELKATIKEAA